ncbi:rRNA maturation RNase YbeY [Neptunomonas marina]|uniref:Endoribonuclease YbeY n=1 Tax=Neptunomonas marina TaxID=1815562 RepID=A0A437QA53_9GAMM|nr:rRNA maturation RNase YbeY [Neptunomonas marina]RVU31366.1 rRNA maturation RNase YbeY [Neptunomonas marina]
MSFVVDVQREVELEAISDADFEQWVSCALTGRKTEGEVCICIVSPEESQQLNNDYRGKDKPTNVLSFPFDAPPEVPVSLLGDLAICADVVASEAQEQGKPLRNHWAHMTIHGVLHLIGYDHIKDADAEAMEALEVEILASLDIPNPYENGE